MILPKTEPSKPFSYLVIVMALLLIGISLGVPIGARYANGYKDALCPTQVIVRPARGVMT